MRKQHHTYSVQSVENAFDLIEALIKNNVSRNASSLAEELGLSSRKMLNLLAALESKQIVERSEGSRYQLGLNAFGLAHQIRRRGNLSRLAHPVMEELVRKHDEAIYLTVPSNDEVLFLDMVDSRQQIKTVKLVGRYFPCLTNAAGKVIKAAANSYESVEKLLKEQASNYGIKDLQKFEQELRQIRERGVAVDDGGLGSDICVVAVAIKDYAGWAIGALTMLAPSFRMFQERIEQEIIPSMLNSAEELSKKFGYSKLQLEV